MANLIWGSMVMLACAAGYACAWRLAGARRFPSALLCIVLCGLVLRVYTAADAHLHEWDERYHALVAKHLAEHWLLPTLYERPLLPYDYTNWTANHIWLHKQPLTLWLMALSVKIFGLHAFVVRLPAVICSTIAIKLVYDIAASWYGRRAAIIAAFLCSIHGLIIELAAGRTATDSVDVMFLFFITLAVWAATIAVRSRRPVHHLVLGAVVGLAMLVKWLPALIVLPVWALLSYPAFRHRKSRWALCGLCIVLAATAVALPWQWYILHHFPGEARWEYGYNSRHFFQALESQDGGVLYYFDRLRMQYGELVYLPVGWITWVGLRRGKAADHALLAWFWIPYLFFSAAATKMQAYTLIAAPAVFIMTALAAVRLEICIRRRPKYRYLLIAIWICLLALPARYTVERVKPFQIADRNPAWHRAIAALRRSSLNHPKTVLHSCPRPVETMFFTACTAYETALDAGAQQRLRNLGYRIVRCPGH